MGSLAVEPMIMYLNQLIPTIQDPTQKSGYEDLRRLLRNRDPRVVEEIECRKGDPNIQPFASPLVLNEIREDLNLPLVTTEEDEVANDETVIEYLEAYKEVVEQSDLSKSKKNKFLRVLDQAIAFVKIPAGTDVDFEEMYPQKGLEELYEAFPYEQLARVIMYLHSMLPDD